MSDAGKDLFRKTIISAAEFVQTGVDRQTGGNSKTEKDFIKKNRHRLSNLMEPVVNNALKGGVHPLDILEAIHEGTTAAKKARQ